MSCTRFIDCVNLLCQICLQWTRSTLVKPVPVVLFRSRLLILLTDTGTKVLVIDLVWFGLVGLFFNASLDV